MDDGGIVGSVELLKHVWHILQTHGPALGLHLNPSKCEWSWLNPSCTLPCPVRLEGVAEDLQIKLIPHAEIQMLGVPLGSAAFVSDFVEKKLLGRLQDTVDRLVEFEDTQAAPCASATASCAQYTLCAPLRSNSGKSRPSSLIP
jgi:hypothetical protein